MTPDQYNAKLVAMLQRLKERMDAELNPDVKRGLAVAIYEIKREAKE